MNARGRTQFAPTAKRTENVKILCPFHTPCLARYSVLHLLGVLSGGNKPPLCKGRHFVNPIISQIGRENKSSADICMCIRRGDLRSPAGEHSSPLPCSENILMRTLLMSPFFIRSLQENCRRAFLGERRRGRVRHLPRSDRQFLLRGGIARLR